MAAPIPPDLVDSFAQLRRLAGQFEGTGRASYPTIASFDYRETLRFVADRERPFLAFEQLSEQRRDGETVWTASHQEAGYLKVIAPGQVMLINAQDNGRLERLDLALRLDGEDLVLETTASAHFNDPRMRASTRTFRLAGDCLTYELGMSTNRVAESVPHLSARLLRVR